MAGFYNFIKAISGKPSTGVDDLALLPYSALPNYSGIGADRQVRRSIAVTKPSFYMMDRSVPTVAALGANGFFVHGVPILGPLAKNGG